MKSNPVDLVVTYVDDTEPKWKAARSEFNSVESPSRFRSWNTLKFWFRSVARNMKFINNIFLVVSNKEQVPSWVDKTKVKVVLHEDIIPAKFLPTFNSTTIEMFLYRIPELSEMFIYSNDDMFVLNKCEAADYFGEDGLPRYQFIKCGQPNNIYQYQCYNSYKMAAKATLRSRECVGNGYVRTTHSLTPMLKSSCMEMWSRVGPLIENSLSKFREPFNMTQYIFPMYNFFTNRFHKSNADYLYKDVSSLQEDDILKTTTKVICVNDSKCSNYENRMAELSNTLRRKFSHKCRFEK